MNTFKLSVKKWVAETNAIGLQQTAIYERLIPNKIKANIAGAFYASEADLVNVAVFGMTAKDWRSQNPEKKGNLRDFATHEQLVIVNTLQSHNAHLIRNNVSQQERLEILNDIAIFEMRVLLKASAAMKRLKA